MRRLSSTLSLLTLPLLILFMIALSITNTGEAQSSCCWTNICEVFPDNGPSDQLCATLHCSGFSHSCPSTEDSLQNCERIPTTCEDGSVIDVRMH